MQPNLSVSFKNVGLLRRLEGVLIVTVRTCSDDNVEGSRGQLVVAAIIENCFLIFCDTSSEASCSNQI